MKFTFFPNSMISPKICEEAPESSEKSDDTDATSTEQQPLTITSKLRNKFLSNNKQNQSKYIYICYFLINLFVFKDNSSSFSTSDPLFVQSFQKSATGNQIFPSTEEFDVNTSI